MTVNCKFEMILRVIATKVYMSNLINCIKFVFWVHSKFEYIRILDYSNNSRHSNIANRSWTLSSYSTLASRPDVNQYGGRATATSTYHSDRTDTTFLRRTSTAASNTIAGDPFVTTDFERPKERVQTTAGRCLRRRGVWGNDWVTSWSMHALSATIGYKTSWKCTALSASHDIRI